MKVHIKDNLFYAECTMEETIVLLRPNGFLNTPEFSKLLDQDAEWQLSPTVSYLVMTPQLARIVSRGRDTNPIERLLRSQLYSALNPIAEPIAS